jgi:predicted MPP superfamily phosphohydrolase
MSWFIIIAMLVLFGINVYIGLRLIRTSVLPKRWAIAAWAFIAVLAFGPPLLFMTGRDKGGPAWQESAHSVGWVLFGIAIVLLPTVVLRDGVAAAIDVARWLRKSDVDPNRRLFIARVLNLGTLGLTGSALGLGYAGAIRRAAVKRVTIPIADLPEAFEGYSIAQISDTHVSATVRRPEMQAVVDLANGLRPDLIAFTGDLVDGHVEHRGDDVAPIADLSAPDGVYFVTGNHEYYWDLEGWLAEVKRHGLTVLENEHRVIERGGSKLVVAGVPDISLNGPRFSGLGKSDPVLAIKGAPKDAVAKILLAHQPRSCFAAEKAGFDFQMCGHTHGGQIFPWTVLIHFFHPFVRGLGKLNNLQVYVNPGSIYWGPPLRLGSPSEVTLFTLTRA